jgi:hypothetical protein
VAGKEQEMISHLIALPLRALVVAAALPTPQAQGATIPLSSTQPAPAIVASLVDADAGIPGPSFTRNPIPRPAADRAGR